MTEKFLLSGEPIPSIPWPVALDGVSWVDALALRKRLMLLDHTTDGIKVGNVGEQAPRFGPCFASSFSDCPGPFVRNRESSRVLFEIGFLGQAGIRPTGASIWGRHGRKGRSSRVTAEMLHGLGMPRIPVQFSATRNGTAAETASVCTSVNVASWTSSSTKTGRTSGCRMVTRIPLS